MSDTNIQSGEGATKVTSVSASEVAAKKSTAGADQKIDMSSPMLSRNSRVSKPTEDEVSEVDVDPAESVQDSEPEDKGPEVTEPNAKAATNSIMSTFESDPQFKPIAMYLDKVCKDIDVNRAFGNAVAYGDVSLIDKAYLQEKLGDQATEVAELAGSLFNAAVERANSQVNEIYNQFGGKSEVDQAIKFFNSKCDLDTRKVLSSLIDSGAKENITYALKQIVDFAKSRGGVITKSKTAVIGQQRQGSNRGLSKEEYHSALVKLGPRAPKAELDKLYRARALGREQGL